MSRTIQEGERVQDADGFRGTVRYVGPVATAKRQEQIWAGVEWDDATRGKHDGSVTTAAGEHVRYFSAPPGSASFLKAEKVDRGVSFVEALQRRYVPMDAPLLAPNNVFEGLYANTNRSGGQKPIEFVGELNIRAHQQLGALRKCTLRAQGIRAAGVADDAAAELLADCAAYEEVDLQGNLLSRWEDVCEMCELLPRLQSLHLNANALGDISPALTLGSLDRLRTLVLNGCGLRSWATVQRLAAAATGLRELYLAENDLADMANQGSAEDLHRIEVLDLSACGLRSWRDLAGLARLPQLRVLTLNRNALADGACVGMEAGSWPALVALGLSGTEISEWPAVDALARLPQLGSLRLQSVPLLRAFGQSEARAVLIGRLPRITQLNGSGISPRERDEAEKTYLRRILREAGGAPGPKVLGATKKWDTPREAAELENTAPSSAPNAAPEAFPEDPAEAEDDTGEESPLPIPLSASYRAASPASALPEAPRPASGVASVAGATDEETRAAVLARHPRYEALAEKWGDLVAPSSGSRTGSTLANEMLELTLVPVAVTCTSLEPVKKRLPATLPIIRLKQLARRLFGVEVDAMALSFRVDKASIADALDDDDETLRFFGVSDGGEIFIQEKE